MPVYALPDEILFPDPELADPSGLLALGGDLSPRRLLTAYANGIFPWYSEGQPILWHSPDPRFVLFPAELRLPRSLRQTLRKGRYQLSFDQEFAAVIRRCAEKERPHQNGTWITEEMIEGYLQLHQLGYAHSVESWLEGQLVGGIYGVSLGSIFFGESMFADQADASKVAFATLAEHVMRWGFTLIDSQVHTEHLERFGAREIPRKDYLELLQRALEAPTRRGPWQLEPNLSKGAS
ncbi:MAG: leucyl/phenylalanyl-tRNA--protein transferase [Rickettsiales bacterium]|nr:leucyl/phenylalanyl-tRNA--protein transferase [Rickettsiales bacterium]